jgi:hypothetical protein
MTILRYLIAGVIIRGICGRYSGALSLECIEKNLDFRDYCQELNWWVEL